MSPFLTPTHPSSMLLAVFLTCASPACGASAAWNPAGAGILAEWTWTGPQVFDLPGAQVRMHRFQAPVTPADAARSLTRAGNDRFSRLQFSGSVLTLSGVHEGRHWLAQLRPVGRGGAGTVGLLSSLEPAARQEAGFDPAQFAPPGARPILRASSRLAEGAGLLASYLCPGSYPRVAAAVRAALQARHWQPAAAVAGGFAHGGQEDPSRVVFTAAGEWAQPGGARLSVHLHPRADTVVLTFWHRFKEPA